MSTKVQRTEDSESFKPWSSDAADSDRSVNRVPSKQSDYWNYVNRAEYQGRLRWASKQMEDINDNKKANWAYEVEFDTCHIGYKK